MSVAECDDGRGERWQVTGDGRILHSASGHCLDEDAGNEHAVELYSCSGASWQVEPVDDFRVVTFSCPQKWDIVGATIVNRNSGRCLDVQ